MTQDPESQGTNSGWKALFLSLPGLMDFEQDRSFGRKEKPSSIHQSQGLNYPVIADPLITLLPYDDIDAARNDRCRRSASYEPRLLWLGSFSDGTCAENKGTAAVDSSGKMDGLVRLMDLSNSLHRDPTWGLVTRQIFQQSL
ncbi:hypothetical protein MG293_017566 [Ovis ammon polii]|uniref:Uncharacterized protein n=1 Tax=Ovis ammon polii TaxID=230172 RepID=A0AAD4Y3S2_OVIAM|nr:hypothetical protein MG293_017566 [Ovis ammon polii]KAI4553833.1 hypothetical protein MJT46_016013 [Ovis ammon polii x Ovis aries]